MVYKKIVDFNKNDKIEGYFLVKTVDCKVTNNSSTNKYLDFNLTDSTGEINAKLWEWSSELEQMFKDNMVVKVRGVANEYRGKLQLKIEKIRNITSEDKINIDDFVLSAPYKSEDMFDTILEFIEKIENKDIRGIVENIILQCSNKMMHYPAAKSNHHAIRGGLLYHTTTMLKAGEKLLEIYTHLNKDLLYAGIILHDIAKIYEMDSSELGIVSQYTTEGQLLGHIILGINLIDRAGKELEADNEVIMLLQHMILSHHYEPEYGSPKKPMIPEAEMLHYLDILDARMYDMQKALHDVDEGDFSEKIYSLENITLYKSKVK
ncbi:3'-5' exoribonuclease YhaM family protein [Clostridium sp. UBA4548]|uniref:3'-5' exoribonuclease YhaM family protein n=1 Tax=Clostridium sp. UBA4548 TaxID=1946361 RepID=UPI0025C30F5C|nr:HD domain-containing protein [Clostridium sp. UBA4548]